MDVQSLTPTERRLVQMLSDGHLHTLRQLRVCLNDDQAKLGTVQQHIYNLRKKLIQAGQDIECVSNSDGAGYRLTVRYAPTNRE